MTKYSFLKILIMEGLLMFTSSPFARCCEDYAQQHHEVILYNNAGYY